MYGVRDDPKMSQDRYLNKIFDYRRIKQKK